MKNLSEFNSSVEFVLTDIDDTLTTEGQLLPEAYHALWKLHQAGIKVIPITGRPAGWCEMIARFWPVAGVVGENGGFYFRYTNDDSDSQKKMKRWFAFDKNSIAKHKNDLEIIKNEILDQVPGSAVASDQFCRLMDLAIDFCEDVPPLAPGKVAQIVQVFKKHGAQAKVSSIHVNGWFGEYDKLTTTLEFFKNEFGIMPDEVFKKAAFVGDSPNDEPMFAQFPHSFGVANVLEFVHTKQLQQPPKFVASKKGGAGFAEITNRILLGVLFVPDPVSGRTSSSGY